MTTGYRPNNSAQLRSEQKARVIDHVCGEINPIKSRLLDQLRALENAECKRAANGLAKIIGELEHWQSRQR